ncbi:MAG: hypothetical protein NTW66_01295 [Candidatus Magasanikbacteria bacterium]|nr:hypothetical protein [Candidatus Magasanikbacteria bacterium]
MSKGFKVSLLIIIILAVGAGLWFYKPWNLKPLRGATCWVTGGKYVEQCGIACVKTCLHKLGDAGKPCQNNKDCKGFCQVIEPDMSKVTSLTSDKKRYEPKELVNCKMGSSGGLINSYQCPPSVKIVAECSKYFEQVSPWTYDNGLIISPYTWAI